MNLKALVILITITICLAVDGQAQKQDQVYFYNGSRIDGKVIKSDSAVVELYLENKNTLFIPKEKVWYIKYGRTRQIERDSIDRPYGIEYGFGLGMIRGANTYPDRYLYPKMDIQAHYRWTDYKNIGLLTGYTSLGDFDFIPLRAVYDMDFFPWRNNSIFLETSMGYAFVHRPDKESNFKDLTGGPNYSIGIGYRWYKNGKSYGFLLSGLNYQYTALYSEYEWNDQYSYIKRQRKLRRMEFKVFYRFL